MDILRRNTDYTLRLLTHLAGNGQDEVLSTRTLAKQEGVSYQLACKLMQKLQRGGIVKSAMGPKGGFALNRPAEEITLREIIALIQGPVHVNRCLLGDYKCPLETKCTMRGTLNDLQNQMDDFLGKTTLSELINKGSSS